MSIPKPSPPRMASEAVKVWRGFLEREQSIRERAMKHWPHPTAKKIVATCDAGIAQIIRDYPEVNK